MKPQLCAHLFVHSFRMLVRRRSLSSVKTALVHHSSNSKAAQWAAQGGNFCGCQTLSNRCDVAVQESAYRALSHFRAVDKCERV